MAKKCKTCSGRGRWQEQEIIDDMVELIWRMCNDCAGTGVDQDAEAGDDFDIEGSSLDDND